MCLQVFQLLLLSEHFIGYGGDFVLFQMSGNEWKVIHLKRPPNVQRIYSQQVQIGESRKGVFTDLLDAVIGQYSTHVAPSCDEPERKWYTKRKRREQDKKRESWNASNLKSKKSKNHVILL